MIARLELRFGAALVAVFVAGMVAPPIALTEEPVASKTTVPDPEGEKLRDTVVFHIRQNYFRLPSVRCKQLTTHLDATVEKEEVIRTKTDKGVVIEFTRSPKMILETDLILAKDNMRADSLNKATNDRWSVSMHNDIWTYVQPSHNFARRKYRDEMGGEGNVDPRNIGAFEQKKGFLRELKEHQVDRHEILEQAGSKRLLLVLSKSPPVGSPTSIVRYEFNAAQNYLPTRIIGEVPDSKQILWIHDIEYQEVIPKSAWFLKTSRLRFFANGKPEGSDEDGWTQQVITEIVGRVRCEEAIVDADFEIQIPQGMNYIDQTIGREKPVPQP